MIGIYKITNKNNGLIYIGQSKNIERRKIEHFNNNRYNLSEIDKAIQLIGAENFSFEVLEECLAEELDQKEEYWIQYYDSYNNGYNKTKGGQGHFSGGRPILTEEDVINIRKAYANREERDKVYLLYQNKITKNGFLQVWQGNRWKNIMPEVYTKENKEYQKQKGKFKSGGEHFKAAFSNEEVLLIRKRYVNETAKQIWEDYQNRCTLGSFKQILTGVKYSNLPIYKKQQKQWINIGEYDEFKTNNRG